MSSECLSILLIPSDGDPHGLLREGLCGARPPMAGFSAGVWVTDPREHYAECAPLALVLVWQGVAVPEGWGRARRAAQAAGCSTGLWVALSDLVMVSPEQTARDVARLLSCRLVLLDADGREVEP